MALGESIKIYDMLYNQHDSSFYKKYEMEVAKFKSKREISAQSL